MKRFVSLLFLVASSVIGFSQVRLDNLVLSFNETFELTDTDIIVVDTLIMQDSSKIILNRDKADNFIHAKVVKVGRGCKIIGNGLHGINGDNGLAGYTAVGPCKNGIPGRNGTLGTSANSGVNLYLYFDQLIIADKFLIELSGGHGGDGGPGGNGGGGSPGTRLCRGGNGGDGGSGGNGGTGGDGGSLTLSCKSCPDLHAWLGNKIYVRGYGGNGGLGGDGGQGGLAGLVSAGDSQDGDQGPKGKQGESGEHGKTGAINFERD